MADNEFNDTDRAIIESYELAVKGIANLFGKGCEVLVHSLENYKNAVVFIENGHNSSRAVGAPITNLAVELINGTSRENKFLDPYESKFPSGERCKSVTIPIKNKDRIIGLLCVNFNVELSVFDFARQFSSGEKSQIDEEPEIYAQNIDELMISMLEKKINDVILDKSVPNREKNKAIILRLNEVGFFKLKGAVAALADKLQISEHTIYSNLKIIQ